MHMSVKIKEMLVGALHKVSGSGEKKLITKSEFIDKLLNSEGPVELEIEGMLRGAKPAGVAKK
jgi:hypothetical protein